MAIRVVQAGAGQVRDLVVVYFLAQQIDDRVKAAAPGAIIVNDTRADPSIYGAIGTNGIEPIRDLAARMAKELGCEIRTITLAGYSAGCKALRTQLLRTGSGGIDGIVAIDGTHASYPRTNDIIEIDPWRDFAEQAKTRRKVMTATHTMLTYTEKLPRPFMCTWNVLRRVTGWALAEQGGDDKPYVCTDGNLTIKSYAAADAAGHRFQGREALPACLAEVVQKLRAECSRKVTLQSESIPPGDAPWHDATKTLGQRALEWSFAQMRAGQHEVPPGSNSGPFVIDCLAPSVRNGKLLGLKAGNWCAAFACAAEAHARLEGDLPPVHEYRCSGFELEQDAMTSGAWRTVDQLRAGSFELEPGDVVIFTRPGESWQRHVARFVTWTAFVEGKFQTIGGNEADEIRLTEHATSEARIRGFIEIPKRDVTKAERNADRFSDAARLIALSEAVMRGEGCDIAAILKQIDDRNDGEDSQV